MNLTYSLKFKERASLIILFLKKNYGFFITLIIYILSSSLWSIVELRKLYSFHAFIYDLGVQVSSLNSIARTYSISKLLVLVPASKPFTLFISYITLLFPDSSTFLYIQPFSVLLASIFIYLIANRKYGSELISIALALSFIFFFPISWYLFFDFHIAGFFSTFFFAAIYFTDTRPKLSWILYFFAATTNIVLAFFVLIFLFILEINYFINKRSQTGNNYLRNNTEKILLLVAPIPTIVFAIWQYRSSGLVSIGGQVNTTSHSIIAAYFANLRSLFNSGFIILFMMAILFIVILALVVKKHEAIYIFSILPVVAFILFGGYAFGIIKAQYDGEYFTPILYFLILIPTFGAKRKNDGRKSINGSIQGGTIIKKGILLFVILIIFMGIFYNPYGPLNNPHLPGIDAYANFGHEIEVTSSDRIADKFVGLVPATSTVLIEDNEPQYADRDRNFLFGPGNLPWLNTNFYNDGPRPASTTPQYIAVAMDDWLTFPFYNSTSGDMLTWFNYFYGNYHYGLVGYDFPYALYKLNYTGSPIIINNCTIAISGGNKFSYPLDTKITTHPVNYSTLLLPGYYKATFTIKITDLRSDIENNSLYFVVNQPALNYANFSIPAFNYSNLNKVITINLAFKLNQISQVQYYLNSYNFNGNFTFISGSIRYIG